MYGGVGGSGGGVAGGVGRGMVYETKDGVGINKVTEDDKADRMY